MSNNKEILSNFAYKIRRLERKVFSSPSPEGESLLKVVSELTPEQLTQLKTLLEIS